MHRFWPSVLEPLVEALRPQVIVEVGTQHGHLTKLLLEATADHGSQVHTIDPVPTFDVDEWRARHGDRFHFHQALSVDALPRVWPIDLLLIDGDHNFFTVASELRIVEEQVSSGHPPPVIALHDVDWPYGRRDMYYDPETVPAEGRHPFARRGMIPGETGLSDVGLNDHLNNAVTEGGPRNGVRTAVEQHLGQTQVEWVSLFVPGSHGLGLLVPAALAQENGRVADLLAEIRSVPWMTGRVQAVELERIWSEIRRTELRHELAAARLATPTAEPERAAEKQSTADGATAAAAAEAERLGRELADTRRELAVARENAGDIELALERARNETGDLRENVEHLERQLGSVQHDRETLEARVAELEAAAGALRSDAESAEAARRRMEQDLTDVREHLERSLIAERAARADAERRAEELDGTRAEQREALEAAADLETRMQAALARSRAELEVSATERASMREELARAAAALEQARAEAEHATAAIREEAERVQATEQERRRWQEDAERSGAHVARLEAEVRQVADEAAAAARRAAEAEAAAETLRAERERLLAEVAELERRPSGSDGDGAAPAVLPAFVPPAPPEPAGPPASADHGLDPESPEYRPRLDFLEHYLSTIRWAERPLRGTDPLALPQPTQHRNVFVDAAAQASTSPSVDVVVCVHNALDDVRLCLWSLAAKSHRQLRLIVVNDGSDEETTRYLETVAQENPAITLIHNAEPPHGYTIAANIGMRAARGDYVVLLNSDTIVTYGWLDRIVQAGESDPRIGILGPLSNAASHQSVPRLRDAGGWATNPLPPWLTPDGMASLIAHVSPRERPRLPFINGFCYVIKRPVFDAIGYFDEENFASGYSEENDFSYRALTAGFELAVVDDGYVYHAKSKSFSPEGRLTHSKPNYQVFLDKHGRETIEALVREMEDSTALSALRAGVEDASSTPAGTASALVAGDADPLTVVFVLPGLGDGGSGGSHSIYQEVRGLRRLGVNARVALVETAFPRAMNVYEDAAEIFQTFTDEDDLIDKTQDADVISATHFKSVAMVARVREARDDFLPAYYIQDYEPFFAATRPEDVEEAIASYTRIEDVVLFAKTHWLCNVVARVHGLHVAKVEPSIDEQLYVPPLRPPETDQPIRVTAMVRPRTPRRQPFGTIAVLRRLQEAYPDAVEVQTFGCNDAELAKVTDSAEMRARHVGLLPRHRVASLLARSDIFLDLSMYQAFGRTALEAMACGCTAVAPRLGGVWEFAQDGENMLVVDTLDENAAFEALVSLVEDRARLSRLQASARETAARYSILRAALSEYVVFEQEHARRFGHGFRRSGVRGSRGV